MRKYSTFLLHAFLIVFLAFIFALPGHTKDEGKFLLVCQTWSRTSTYEALGKKKEIVLSITIPEGPVNGLPVEPEEVVALHSDFKVTMLGSAGSVSLIVTDRKSGKEIQSFLWQFAEIPRNNFQATGQGFTGLIYYRNPTSDSEMQMICLVRESEGEAQIHKPNKTDHGR